MGNEKRGDIIGLRPVDMSHVNHQRLLWLLQHRMLGQRKQEGYMVAVSSTPLRGMVEDDERTGNVGGRPVDIT